MIKTDFEDYKLILNNNGNYGGFNGIFKKDELLLKIKNYEKDYNLFVMGNLRYNFLLERLTGKFGVKILQNCNVPIFIA